MTNNSGGQFNILSGGSYSCPACAETFNVGGTVNNSGTMNLGTGSTWQGTINNNSGGTITDGGNGAQIQLGASSTMNNYGSFVSRTAGTSGIFNNYSTGTLTTPATCSFTVKNGSTFTNDGTVTLPSSNTAFSVDAGGTMANQNIFSGIGGLTQSGTFTNSAAAKINPGNSPGKLTVTGSLDLGSATYNAEVAGTVQGTSYDWLAVSGTATIGGSSKLHLIFSVPIVSGTTFDVLTAGTVSGTFAGGNVTFANTGTGNVTAVSVTYPGGNTIRVTATSLLPVELVRFTGKEMDGMALLEWETASELNNEGFHIERSTDGLRWSELGFVAGNGTTTEAQQYEFLDEKPLSPHAGGCKGGCVNYYRLRQMDFDGKEEYSEVVSVTSSTDWQSVLRAYPNPVAGGELTVVLPENLEGETPVQLFDSTGRLVRSAEMSVGANSLDVRGLAAGMYHLRAGVFYGKIVVER
jgi:hypothetical protein